VIDVVEMDLDGSLADKEFLADLHIAQPCRHLFVQRNRPLTRYFGVASGSLIRIVDYGTRVLERKLQEMKTKLTLTIDEDLIPQAKRTPKPDGILCPAWWRRRCRT
jgi:hypothetical protein